MSCICYAVCTGGMHFIKSLDLELDTGHGGVPKHLGIIAESMYEWEGRIAEELGLTAADVAHINTKHPSSLKLQTYDNVASKIRYKNNQYYNFVLQESSFEDVAAKAGYQSYI